MADAVKDLRRLVIKAYHMNEVAWGEENKITVDGIAFFFLILV